MRFSAKGAPVGGALSRGGRDLLSVSWVRRQGLCPDPPLGLCIVSDRHTVWGEGRTYFRERSRGSLVAPFMGEGQGATLWLRQFSHEWVCCACC